MERVCIFVAPPPSLHPLVFFKILQSIAVGELVAKRLEAAVKLQANPTDASAMQTLVEVEVEASRWCQSMATPGKFTGAKVVKPMCMKDHNTGYQAWAKKVYMYELRLF